MQHLILLLLIRSEALPCSSADVPNHFETVAREAAVRVDLVLEQREHVHFSEHTE
jgi:hypothetical protein